VIKQATTVPIIKPITAAETITKKDSYMKMRLPSFLVTPIDLSTPYSQILSLIFCVVATKSKKNVNTSAMMPITPTKTVKMAFAESRDSEKAYVSTTIEKLSSK